MVSPAALWQTLTRTLNGHRSTRRSAEIRLIGPNIGIRILRIGRWVGKYATAGPADVGHNSSIWSTVEDGECCAAIVQELQSLIQGYVARIECRQNETDLDRLDGCGGRRLQMDEAVEGSMIVNLTGGFGKASGILDLT